MVDLIEVIVEFYPTVSTQNGCKTINLSFWKTKKTTKNKTKQKTIERRLKKVIKNNTQNPNQRT